LGHSLATTVIYLRADPGEKLESIEAVVPPYLRGLEQLQLADGLLLDVQALAQGR